MEKGVLRKDFNTNSQHTQRGNKIVNSGFNKIGDIARKPIK